MVRKFRQLSWFLAGLVLCGAATALGQAPDAPIESSHGLWEDDGVMDQVEAIYAEGTSLDVAEARAALRAPTHAAVETLPAATEPLEGAEIARRAREGYLRLGWYGGTEENDLGLALGAAFAVAKDTFVTCRHVVAPGGIKIGCLVAIDDTGGVHPVQAIVAADRASDVALVRVEGTDCRPLALSADVSPGDRVYCFSDPLDAYGYFDEGIVNRFYRLPPPARRPVPEDSPSLIRMHVGVDWAPGSSGSATLDRFGNATGIVSAVQTLSEDYPFIPYESPEMEIPKEGESDESSPAKTEEGADVPEETPKKKRRRRESAPTLMVLHEATPVRAVLDLIAASRDRAKVESKPATAGK